MNTLQLSNFISCNDTSHVRFIDNIFSLRKDKSFLFCNLRERPGFAGFQVSNVAKAKPKAKKTRLSLRLS